MEETINLSDKKKLMFLINSKIETASLEELRQALEYMTIIAEKIRGRINEINSASFISFIEAELKI